MIDAPRPALGELARTLMATVRSTASDYAEAVSDSASPFASNPAGLRRANRETYAAFTAACDAVESQLVQLVALATGGATSGQQQMAGGSTAKSEPAAPNQQQEPPLKGDSTMTETATAAPNEYAAQHFNRVVGNYSDALLLDGQGSDQHKRAAGAVDVLMGEYALATELLDYVKFELCFGPIERSKMAGGDYRALAGALQGTYPMLAAEIQHFTDDALATDAL